MSITQVAQQAGVSISTVSRYLRGNLNVNPTTAKKINEAAREFGYTPRNTEPSSHEIALVVPTLSNPFYCSLCESITLAAARSHFTIDIKLTHGNRETEYQIVDNIAQERKYYGLIYAGFNDSNPALERIISTGIHTVLIDETLQGEEVANLATVTVDNFSGGYQATRYLLSLGHKRIAYISGPHELSTSRERLQGYTSALHAANIQVDPSLIFTGPYTEEFGSSVFPYLIENADPATAIFCSSDVAAIGLLGAAEQYGLKIPDDLSVIGCDGIHIGQWVSPSLTTLRQPVDEIAQHTITVLQDETTQHVQLPLTLVIRNSTQRKAE